MFLLRIPDSYDAKRAKNLQPLDNRVCNSGNKPPFQNLTKKPFCPLLHRCKKCSNILKVAMGIYGDLFSLGMAYRITDISEKPIYRLFCKYRISVSVKIISVKISDIGYRQNQNIRYWQMTKYRTFDIFRKDVPTLK